jgi:hypothetical protein
MEHQSLQLSFAEKQNKPPLNEPMVDVSILIERMKPMYDTKANTHRCEAILTTKALLTAFRIQS